MGLAASALEAVTASRILDLECERAIAALRIKCPQAFAHEPLPPGKAADPVQLPGEQANALYASAFAAAIAPGQAPAAAVVWAEADAELLVRTGRVRARFLDGLVLVGIPVYAEQTEEVEIVVSFAVGSANLPAGLVIATETAPRGPAVIVDRWGDRLVAAAYAALISLAEKVAGAAGQDLDGSPLLPAALTATPNGLAIVPQARHPFDRVRS